MKKLFTVLGLAIISIAGFGQNLQDSLIVYYPFDGNTLDYSGHELNGILNGPVPAPDRYGTVDGALYFDGLNSFVVLPTNELLKPPVPLSFSFWVKTESNDEFKNKFFVTDFQDDNYSGCWMSLNSSAELTLNFGENGGDAGNQSRRSMISTAVVTIGEWVHLAGVIRGATDMSLYINGAEVGGYYDGSGATTIGYSGSPGKIGCVPPQTASPYIKYFQGTMDDFAMWSRDLSSEDIQELYNNGLNVSAINETGIYPVSVFPNPCHQFINVDCSALQGDLLEFQLLSPKGSKIIEQTLKPGENTNILLEEVSTGLYVYRIIRNNKTLKSGKLLVN